ncbi:hypothetical protein [Micromonospora sp. DT62]|uniref:hypothetical protein n=1 Tax=Micromonospora sp. DT62 TaxID=3416521 RepID=UPI003CF442F3
MERDWFDWASLIFNTLATTGGLVGLFVAVRAYKVAKSQGRKTFELEILRELSGLLDRSGELHSEPDRQDWLPTITAQQFARMQLLHEEEFPFTRALARYQAQGVADKEIADMPEVREMLDSLRPRATLSMTAHAVMYHEILKAMKKRAL